MKFPSGQDRKLNNMNDEDYMLRAISAARQADERGEVPIGAVLTYRNEIISVQMNSNRTLNDPTAHAEIMAIREACEKWGAQRIPECDLYVTLEPCTMCAAAIAFARLKRLVIGAEDPKGGGVLNGVKFFDQPTCHHKKITIMSGVLEDECAQLLKDFFKKRRQM